MTSDEIAILDRFFAATGPIFTSPSRRCTVTPEEYDAMKSLFRAYQRSLARKQEREKRRKEG